MNGPSIMVPRAPSPQGALVLIPCRSAISSSVWDGIFSDIVAQPVPCPVQRRAYLLGAFRQSRSGSLQIIRIDGVDISQANRMQPGPSGPAWRGWPCTADQDDVGV